MGYCTRNHNNVFVVRERGIMKEHRTVPYPRVLQVCVQSHGIVVLGIELRRHVLVLRLGKLKGGGDDTTVPQVVSKHYTTASHNGLLTVSSS